MKMIVAVSKDMGIGCDGKLLFESKKDMKHFIKTTAGCMVVMGKDTYEEIGKPLPNRINVVVSSSEDLFDYGVSVVRSVAEAVALAKDLSINNSDICFIGGSRIYESVIESVSDIHITFIEDPLNGIPRADRFFPYTIEFLESLGFERMNEVIYENDGDLMLDFAHYQRKQ